MEDEVLLEARGLVREFSGGYGVWDLDLSLHRGEVLGLLGPNGAGKSTVLQMLSGNRVPVRGTVHINGIDLLAQPRAARACVGYLPEQPPVYRDLSVQEYLRYCARLHGLAGRVLTAAVERACQYCGLDAVRKRLIGNLSKGFQQRVGIAQAILHQPDVIILDEPTVGLDPLQVRELRALIRELGQACSLILSTHVFQEVEAVCNRVQILNQGRTLLTDSLANIGSLEQVFFDRVYRDDPALESKPPGQEAGT
ncbi:MAG: ABC transporter ATP-binding protein [Thiothrix sp.]|nr:ABC transporter ATP-binding protein [Thiothrix sp.]